MELYRVNARMIAMAALEASRLNHEIAQKQDLLRRAFLNEAVVTNPEKGYISVPSVNQRINLELQGYAADLIVDHYKNKGVEFDIIVGIPNSGIPLATSVAERLKLPLAPGRKGRDIPGSWKMPILIDEDIPSFTTGITSAFVFNGMREGDKVLAVEDVIAKGETMTRIHEKFSEHGIVLHVASYFAKTFQGGVNRLKDLGLDPYFAIGIEKIEMEEGIWVPILEKSQS